MHILACIVQPSAGADPENLGRGGRVDEMGGSGHVPAID